MTIEEYLKQDRQWPRHLRLGHARLKQSRSETDEDKRFWKAVIKANAYGKNEKEPKVVVLERIS